MAATVTIMERIGAGDSQVSRTAGSTIRLQNADTSVVDNANPMVIPAADADLSYEKWLALKITDTPPSDVINNVKFYFDGAIGFGTGVSVYGRSVSAFSTPAELTTITGLTDASTWTSAAPLALSSTNYSGSGTIVGSNVVLTLVVSATATVGALTAETITFRYDEI